MRIAAIYRHYWPDSAPYGKILKAILENLAKDGHDVTVITAQPSYNDIQIEQQPWNEKLNGVKIARIRLLKESKSNMLSRLVNVILFTLGAILYILKCSKFDLLMFNSTPPYVMGFVARTIKLLKNTDYLFHVQDIHPEIVKNAGGIFGKPAVFKFFRQFDLDTCKSAKTVVTLSQDMADALRERGYDGNNIKILNNFMLPDYDELTEDDIEEASIKRDENKYKVLFAGNLGIYQGLEHVVEAARILEEYEDIQFIFQGEGSAKKMLIEKSGDMLDRKIFFIPFQPLSITRRNIENTDLSLISLEPGIYKHAFPSKTMTYLAAGARLVVIVEPESDLARLVEDNKIGFISPTNDASSIAEKILKAYKEADSLMDRDKIKAMGIEEFGMENVMTRWSKLFKEMS